MKKKKKKHRFDYMLIIYNIGDEGQITGVKSSVTGWIWRENEEQAKEAARELWKEHPMQARFMIMKNKNGKDIVNVMRKPQSGYNRF